MGFRVRKSFKLAPGVRMTVTPKGVGVSAGTRGARVSAHSSGRVTRTVGIPGTGISHVETVRSGSRSTASRQAPAATHPAPARPASPGLMAPKWEKELYKAVSQQNFSGLPEIAKRDPKARGTCMFLDAFAVSMTSGDNDRAQDIMEAIWTEGYDPARDEFLTKYGIAMRLSVQVAEGVTAELVPDRDAIGLVLAELRQDKGDIAAAIDLVEQLTPSTIAAVSLAELYAEQSRWDDIVDLTNGITNEDDATTYLLIQRGEALRELGHYNAAREAFKSALAPRARLTELRHRAWVERGQAYLAEGKRALARRDFERVLAENSNYPGLKELLASVEGE
jgi:tetratricopeptide (TPR) repeat protein